jgi:parallel beta-helix repeat protein
VTQNSDDGISLSYSSGSQIENNTITSNGDFGVYYYVTSTTSNIKICKNTIQENVNDGIYFNMAYTNTCSNLTIWENTIHANGDYGIYLETTTSSSSKIQGSRINGNTITSNTDYGIFCNYHLQTSDIRNNVLTRNGGGIYLRYYCDVNNIIGNSIGNTTYNGLILFYSDYNTIETNVILNHSHAIHLEDSESNQIHGNKLRINPGQFGFYFEETYSYDNVINTTNIVNTVPVRWYTWEIGTAGSPFSLSNIEVELAGITNVAQIMFYHCEHVIISNSLANNGAAKGIYGYFSKAITISQTTIVNNTNDGIHLQTGDNHNVNNVTTGNNTGSGIEIVTSSNSKIDNNTIINNDQYGLHFTSVSHPVANFVIINNKIINNSNNGIYACVGTGNTCTDWVLSLNRIKGNIGDGIFIQSTSSNSKFYNTLITTNNITSNQGSGIWLDNRQEGCNILNNDILLSTAHGINLRGTSADVKDNWVVKNTQSGIRLQSCKVNLIDNNELIRNANGIRFVYSDINEIHNNLFTINPGQFGLYFDDELSYNNNISTTNIVNQVPVRWYRYETGDQNNPMVLSNILVDLKGITNIAQIMIYDCSFVNVINSRFTNGTGEGLYLYSSSTCKAINNTFVANQKSGIHLNNTKSCVINNNSISESTYGCYLRKESPNNNFSHMDIDNIDYGVYISNPSTSVKNNIFEINNNNVAIKSVTDSSYSDDTPNSGNNMICDAGLNKYIGEGETVNFDDNMGVSFSQTDIVTNQKWNFGDGTTPQEQTNGNSFHPSHTYTTVGTYDARYSITIGGTVYYDDVEIIVGAHLSPPQNLQAIAGDGYINLSWSAPVSDGGSQITNYRVYRGYSSGGESYLVQIGAIFYYNNTNLINNQTYYYQVCAVNGDGVGPMSNEVNATPGAPDTTPTPPQNLLPTAGNGYVHLSWGTPVSDGGSAITNYRIYRGFNQTSLSFLTEVGTTQLYNDTTVVNNNTYHYQVCAVNVLGESGPSNTGIAVPGEVPLTTPGEPQDVQSSSGAGYVHLSWSPPLLDGGTAITNYVVYRRTSSSALSYLDDAGLALDYNDTSVTNGNTYYYQVRAMNFIGEGGGSNQVNETPFDWSSVNPPYLYDPSGVSYNGYIYLEWDSIDIADGYILEEDDNFAFTSPTEVYSGSWTFYDTTLSTSGTYYYRVKGVSNGHETGYSDIIDVEVEIVSRTSDSDGDGLNDYEEIFTYGTDPANTDSDGDGYTDGEEVERSTDPLDANSIPEINNLPFDFGLAGLSDICLLIMFIMIIVVIGVIVSSVRRKNKKPKEQEYQPQSQNIQTNYDYQTQPESPPQTPPTEKSSLPPPPPPPPPPPNFKD